MAEYLSERELRVLRRERIRDEEEIETRERLMNESLMTIDQTGYESDQEEGNTIDSNEMCLEIAKLDDILRKMNKEPIVASDIKTSQSDDKETHELKLKASERIELKDKLKREMEVVRLRIKEREQHEKKDKVRREIEDLKLCEQIVKEKERIELEYKRKKELEELKARELRLREKEKYFSHKELEIEKMEEHAQREQYYEQIETEKRRLEEKRFDKETEEIAKRELILQHREMLQRELEQTELEMKYRDRESRSIYVSKDQRIRMCSDNKSVCSDNKEESTDYARDKHTVMREFDNEHRERDRTRYMPHDQMMRNEYDSRSVNIVDCTETKIEIEYRMKVRKEIEDELRKEIKEQLRKENEEKCRLKEISKATVKREIREKRMKEEMQLLQSIKILNMQQEINDNTSDSDISEDEEAVIMKQRINSLKAEKDRLENKMKSKSSKRVSTKDDKVLGKPKLPQFDGSLFEEWKLEVKSLMESAMYSEFTITQAIRNSLMGTTRKILLTLRPSATARELMDKLDDIYGNLRSGDSIIHEFYSAKQSEKETSSEWGLRLETLFYQALARDEIEESRKDIKLKERFWRGLSSEKIKTAIRTTYESNSSFNILRKKARTEELEIDMTNKDKVEKPKTIDDKLNTEQMKVCQPLQDPNITNSKIEELLRKMTSLEKEMREIKRSQTTNERDSPRDYHQNNRQFRRRTRFENANKGQQDNYTNGGQTDNSKKGHQTEHKKQGKDEDLNC